MVRTAAVSLGTVQTTDCVWSLSVPVRPWRGPPRIGSWYMSEKGDRFFSDTRFSTNAEAKHRSAQSQSVRCVVRVGCVGSAGAWPRAGFFQIRFKICLRAQRAKIFEKYACVMLTRYSRSKSARNLPVCVPHTYPIRVTPRQHTVIALSQPSC